MQATATPKRQQRTETWIGFGLLALLGILMLGVIVTAERTGAPPAVVGPQPNTLPEAVVVRPLSFEQMRFIEINMLPGDDGSAVAPSSDRAGERH